MQPEITAQSSTALLMACLSNRAYAGSSQLAECESLPVLKQYAVSQSFRVSYSGKLGTTHGEYIIARNKSAREQVIAIQGTNSLKNWFTDFDIKPVLDDDLQVPVHRGFRAYALAVRADLQKNSSYNPAYKTNITGHSLGGAAALLLGLYTYVTGSPPSNLAAVYTFGQPRVVDNRGAVSWPDFAKRVFRYEDCDDVAPLIPTGGSFLSSLFTSYLGDEEATSYQHLGQSILLMDHGKYWLPGEIGVDRDRIADIKFMIEAYKAKEPIDHSIRQYVSRIAAMFGGGRSPVPVNPIHQFRNVCTPVAPTA